MLFWQVADYVTRAEFTARSIGWTNLNKHKISAPPPKSLNMQKSSWQNACSERGEEKLFCIKENVMYCKGKSE